MKKLNNKGYMLVEIILAFVLAIGITYFMTELVIKLKNKNDDLLVKTIVSTDQTIIYNTIMNDVYAGTFSCDKIEIDGNKFIYDGKIINVVSEYASVENMTCNDETDETSIHIPINVKQLPDENFDVRIGLGDGIEGNTTLSCKLEMTSDNVIKLSDDFSFSGRIIYQGFDSNYEGENVTSKTISDIGTYTYYIKAKSGLTEEVTGSCGIEVNKTKEVTNCPGDYSPCSGSGCECYRTDSSKLTSSTTYKCLCNGSVKLTSSSSISDGACYGECLNWYNAGQFTASVSSSTSYDCTSGSYYNGTCYFYSSASGTSFDCTSNDLTKANDTYCWKTVE